MQTRFPRPVLGSGNTGSRGSARYLGAFKTPAQIKNELVLPKILGLIQAIINEEIGQPPSQSK